MYINYTFKIILQEQKKIKNVPHCNIKIIRALKT